MAIDPTDIVKTAGSVASSEAVGGTLSDAWQALFGDRIAAWRLRNAAKTQIKVRKEFDRLGLKPDRDRIPERYAVTWFEEASKQDEDEIQELFARLLAQAAAGNESALDRRNLAIVSRLTPTDAALFEELALGGWGAQTLRGTLFWDADRRFFSTVPSKVSPEEFSRSFEHLMSLGILTRVVKSKKSWNMRSLPTNPTFELTVRNLVLMTETGQSLYSAVKRADQAE